jgi:hypothetical protein
MGGGAKRSQKKEVVGAPCEQSERKRRRLLARRASAREGGCLRDLSLAQKQRLLARRASEASAREGGCSRDLSLAQMQMLFAQPPPPALLLRSLRSHAGGGTHLSGASSGVLAHAAVLACRNFGRSRVGIGLARVARGALRDAVDGAAVLADLAVNAVVGARGARRADVPSGRAGDAGRVVLGAVVFPDGADLATPALGDLTRTNRAGVVRGAAGVVRCYPRFSSTFDAIGLPRNGCIPAQEELDGAENIDGLSASALTSNQCRPCTRRFPKRGCGSRAGTTSSKKHGRPRTCRPRRLRRYRCRHFHSPFQRCTSRIRPRTRESPPRPCSRTYPRWGPCPRCRSWKARRR